MCRHCTPVATGRLVSVLGWSGSAFICFLPTTPQGEIASSFVVFIRFHHHLWLSLFAMLFCLCVLVEGLQGGGLPCFSVESGASGRQ